MDNHLIATNNFLGKDQKKKTSEFEDTNIIPLDGMVWRGTFFVHENIGNNKSIAPCFKWIHYLELATDFPEELWNQTRLGCLGYFLEDGSLFCWLDFFFSFLLYTSIIGISMAQAKIPHNYCIVNFMTLDYIIYLFLSFTRSWTSPYLNDINMIRGCFFQGDAVMHE